MHEMQAQTDVSLKHPVRLGPLQMIQCRILQASQRFMALVCRNSNMKGTGD